VITQFRRYALTGVVTNFVFYGHCLGISRLGMRPGRAMSLLYGAIVTVAVLLLLAHGYWFFPSLCVTDACAL
jgi:hypothetical protein